MLPNTRSAFAAVAFVLGAAAPLYGAMAAHPQRDAAVTPPRGNTPAPDAVASDGAPTATSDAAADPHHFQDGIVAIVNDKAISKFDLEQRIALIMSTSNIPSTPEMKKKIHDQVLEQLETEMIQRQEALKNDISVSSVDIDKQIQAILTDNHMTLDQLKGVLGHGHVDISTLRSQIAAQVLWQKTVEQQYAGRVTITPEQVDAEMRRISEGQNKVHYLVSEIFLPVDNPDQDGKILKDAQGLYAQMQSGAPFQAIARQFSQSPSAAQGGDIGVVYDGQLALELNAALGKMKTGELSPPIRSTGGYFILALRQRLEPVGTKIVDPSAESQTLPATLPLARLLLPLPPKTAKNIVDSATKIASEIGTHVSSCDMIPKIAAQVKGAIYMNLGMARLADLSQQIRDVLAKTEPGGVAQPFQSDAGIELFVRCDKAIVKLQAYQLPTREQVENQLFSDQISAMARRYTRDLKRDADIELR